MRYLISLLIIGAAIGAAIVGIAGFQGRFSRQPPIEVFPDMDRQAKLRPQEPNHFFTNGISSQLPPAGTVARSEVIMTAGGPVYDFQDTPVNTGQEVGKTNFVEINPLIIDLPLLQRGHDRFDIYCSSCHGKLGDGNGILKKIGALPAVANLHDQRIVGLTDGEIFNTITHGKGLMGPVGPMLPTQDRWAVVAYLRALQLSWLGSTNELTAAETATLK